MNSIRKAFAVVSLAVLYAMSPASASAAPVIYIDLDPAAGVQTSKIIAVGGSVSADIWIKDLTQTVGAWDVDMSFNATVLGAPRSISIDPDNNLNPDSGGLLGFGFYAPGVANTGESGTPAGSNLALAPFRLGTVNLTGLALGNSILSISYQAISNSPGLALIQGITTQQAIVCVQAATAPQPCNLPAAAPEPVTMSLLSGGVAALLARRRMSRKAAI
jgi:hypothetical protein